MFLVGSNVLCPKVYIEYMLQEQKLTILKYIINSKNFFNISPGFAPPVLWEELFSPLVSRAGMLPTLKKKT